MSQKRRASLYRGKISHQRMRPKDNSFSYGAYFIFLDIERINELTRSRTFFSHNHFNLWSLYDSDHGARDGTSLRKWIDQVLRRANIDLGGGQVMLLTFPRVLRFRFFPVSFWYCFHEDQTLRAILAEVTNTLRQHHNYLLHKEGCVLGWNEQLLAHKVFYVSPFIQASAVQYRFLFTDPAEDLNINMDVVPDNKLMLQAKASLSKAEFTDRQILKTILRYGPMSARSLFFIYWQALRIKLKGIKNVPRFDAPEEETSL